MNYYILHYLLHRYVLCPSVLTLANRPIFTTPLHPIENFNQITLNFLHLKFSTERDKIPFFDWNLENYLHFIDIAQNCIFKIDPLPSKYLNLCLCPKIYWKWKQHQPLSYGLLIWLCQCSLLKSTKANFLNKDIVRMKAPFEDANVHNKCVYKRTKELMLKVTH